MQLFKVLASLPDDRQQERIETMMQSVDKSMSHAESRIGLLVAAKELSASKGMSTDFQQISAVDRYIEVTKALYTLPKVAQWMQERRDFWIWMEQWGQARNVISSRQDVAVQLPLSHMNQYSDIELNAGFGNDSDDDDEDRRYESCEFSRSVEVHAAGVRAVNGTYCITGAVDSVARYTKEGIWKSRREVFSLYRCQLNDQSRKWFISIVPQNSEPGTDKDVDFYWAAASEEKSKLRSETPPKQGWSVAKHFGLLPVPVVSLATTLLGEDEVLGGGHDNSWNGEEEGIDRSHPNSRHVV